MLDTRVQLETPEGIELELTPAGPWVRIAAFLIDALIRLLLVLLAGLVLAWGGQFGGGLWLLVAFLLEWWYPVLFELFYHGQTPGKKRMGLQVIQEDGTLIRFGPSLTRNLLRAVDLLPVGYLAGVLAICLSQKFQRLGDLAAGTLVVYKPKAVKLHAGGSEGVAYLRQPLQLKEQQAILAFSERRAELSAPRRFELASIVYKPLDVPAVKAEERLYQLANGLSGRSGDEAGPV